MTNTIDANPFLRHERNLRVEAMADRRRGTRSGARDTTRSAAPCHTPRSAFRSSPRSLPPCSAIQWPAPASASARRRHDLLSRVFAVVHQRDEPVRHILEVRDDRPAGARPLDVLVVRNLVELERIAPLGVAARRVRAASPCPRSKSRSIFISSGCRKRSRTTCSHVLPDWQLDRSTRRRRTSSCCRETLSQRHLRLDVLELLEELLPREVGPVPDRVVPRDAGPV